MGEEKYNDGFEYNDPEELGLDDLINLIMRRQLQEQYLKRKNKNIKKQMIEFRFLLFGRMKRKQNKG